MSDVPMEKIGEYPYQKTDEYLDHVKLINQLREELSTAQKETSMCKVESESLAMSLYSKHYKKEAPDFGLCDTPSGVITQIDNMVAGLSEENERLIALLDQTREDLWMRAGKDSGGFKVINLSDFIWQDIKATLKAAKEGEQTT